MFVTLLKFSWSSATKCVSLNNEQYWILLNPNEFNCYQFMFNLVKYDGSCNFSDGVSRKICVLSKT